LNATHTGPAVASQPTTTQAAAPTPRSPNTKTQHAAATRPQEDGFRGRRTRPSTRQDARWSPLLLAGFSSPFELHISQKLGICKGQSRRQYFCSVRASACFARASSSTTRYCSDEEQGSIILSMVSQLRYLPAHSLHVPPTDVRSIVTYYHALSCNTTLLLDVFRILTIPN
jgi:hypothetical protein